MRTALDEAIFHWLYALGQHESVRLLAIALAYLGSGYTMFLLIPGFFLPRWRKTAVALLVALLMTAVLVFLTKHAVGRVRPWLFFHLPPPFQAPTDPSFPSGHAGGSGTVAAFVLVLAYRKGRFARELVLLPVIALLIALSRVVLGVHYPLDVTAGLLLGGTVGSLVAWDRTR